MFGELGEILSLSEFYNHVTVFWLYILSYAVIAIEKAMPIMLTDFHASCTCNFRNRIKPKQGFGSYYNTALQYCTIGDCYERCLLQYLVHKNSHEKVSFQTSRSIIISHGIAFKMSFI
uniref:Uncharacterized protein n=1 Tax=Glossina brevipalpis TaxID=37001 RepID=A0A1A9WR19_9MUSC